MNVITKRFDISAKKPFTLVPMSDIHMGNSGCDEDLLKQTVSWIKKNGAHAVILGDHIDSITKSDKRFEIDSIAKRFHGDLENLPYAETKAVVDALKPIRSRILAAMTGNHESTTRKRESFDSGKMFCDDLKIDRMYDPSFLRLVLARSGDTRTIDIFCTHGTFIGGGRKLGAKVNNIRDLAAGFEADIYLAGHSHQLFTVSDETIGVGDTGNMKTRRRFYVNTGSFLRTYINDGKDSWASRSCFLPARVGVARIDIYAKRTKSGGWYPDIHVRT